MLRAIPMLVRIALLYVLGTFFTLCFANGGLTVTQLTTDELEDIRRAAVAYLEAKKPLKWEIHASEIGLGGILLLGGEQRIGRWKIERQPDSVTLIREADIAPEVRRFGLTLSNTSGRYQVTADFWERESFH